MVLYIYMTWGLGGTVVCGYIDRHLSSMCMTWLKPKSLTVISEDVNVTADHCTTLYKANASRPHALIDLSVGR